ncbi:MAG: glycosyl transferase family 28 [Bacteroidetes bacterium]|nr:glycosyl transferase family 28 [Bacteroidota bacterium]
MTPVPERKKRILIAPLDWGLGHATRCIPVIREFTAAGADVIIGSNSAAMILLRKEFPQLEWVELPAYNIRYRFPGSMFLSVTAALPGIIFTIIREHNRLQQIIRTHKIDAVISDNRWGLWTKKVPSVFITHQVMIKCPHLLKFLEPLLCFLHKQIINRFTFCWIPDLEGDGNLSGDLSHKYPVPRNAKFIGWISRFMGQDNENRENIYDLIVILSGPEPQRTKMEKNILNQLKSFSGKVIFCRGLPAGDMELPEWKGYCTVEFLDHLNSDEMALKILQSGIIIARSGYSTLMDLAVLGKKAILIPTPGQPEQEYLAEYSGLNNRMFIVREKNFLLHDAITRAMKIHNEVGRIPVQRENSSKLKTTVQEFLNRIRPSW